ncbi:unnamed protein product [Rotaria sordida]|uniref:Ubiquitin carboxyl-terminal hydrolase 36 n=1 Tax=Rotaria sordida TaxID=392033 RepID=A0A818VXJ5_9BILA|nr:unnamed protein product [Rotaria sordida]
MLVDSTCSSPDQVPDENHCNSENTAITDADIEELNSLLPCFKQTPTDYELRLKKACQKLLQHPCSIISTLSLVKKIDQDAANLLVDECLLLFTNDLFKADSHLDLEGYIKYIPDTINLIFINRLLHYEVDPTLYFKNITIPQVWKSYLSNSAIILLRTMEFYKNILDSTPPDSLDNLQSMNYPNNDQNVNPSLTFNDQLWNKQSQHLNRPNEEKSFSILLSSCNMDHLTLTSKLSHQQKFCSICELTKIISSIHPSSTNTLIESHCLTTPSADSIRTHVHLISPIFNIEEQEDVSEFIITLLEHFVCCLPSHLSISSTLSLEPTIIDQIFNIKLLSSGQCLSCLYTFKKEEITNILLIEINNLNNLTDALTHFFDREVVSSFTCSNCCKCVKLDKRITINELSPILIINFKRCSISFDATEKLSHQVNYNELLDVSPYMTSYSLASNDKTENINSSDNSFYKLYAVINHIGDDLNSGHYYSYVRSVDNLWFLVDDAHCRNVSSTEVLNHSEALILFYAKIFHTSKTMDTSFQQIPQPLTSLVTEDNIVLHSSILSSSMPANSTSMNESITFLNEKISKPKSLINTTKTMQSDTFNSLRDTQSTSENTLSTVDSSKTIVLNKDPIPGETESSITIIKRCSNKLIKDKQKTTDHILNKASDTSQQPMYYKKSFLNKTFDDSIHQVPDETCKKLASVAAGVSIDETYEDTLKQKHFFRLSQNELLKMNKYRQEKLEKESNHKMELMGLAIDSSSFGKKQSKNGNMSTTNNDLNGDESYQENNNIKKKKVNIEYLNLLLPHLKHYNSACGLCIRSRYFGKNVSKPNSLLVRCIIQCSGSICEFKCTVHVLNNGDCFLIAINPNIFHHVGERLSRPIRGSQRQALIEKFKSGASLYRLHAQYDKERTKNEKKGFNYDRTGKSKKIFKKIKAEAVAASLLSPDITQGILNLHDQLVDEINSDGIVKGAIQVVQLRPFCIVAFTEASIRLYDAIVSHPETVLSWDATGGIIKNTASISRQCLYYELTVSHPNITNEDSLVPLTFMLSESQTLHTVTNWLTAFKESYKKVFPHKKDSFPRPAVILSDRAQVLLQAALHFFNDENYQQFLARAYRIVTHQAIQNDLSKTIIHACLSHFMLDMRKRVNKYLHDDIRELGMWCVALLVNTNTWVDMKENWRLICEVFINYSTNETVTFKQHYSILLSRISQITNDPNSSAAINQSKEIISESTDPFEFDDDIENDNLHHNLFDSNKTMEKTKQLKRSYSHRTSVNNSIIDEEKQLNEIDSNFKIDLQKIYYECYEKNIKSTASSSTLDKAAKSVRQWLAYFNQHCIPTVAIWSNLLLGDLSRHVISSIRAFDNLLLNQHDQRTNAISERRMAIVKRTQLGTQTYMRSDVVLQILVQDMQKFIENFSISYLASTSDDSNNESSQQRLKELKENWRQKNRRGSGFYAKKPDKSIMNNLQYALIASSTTINDGLSIPDLPVSNWLNVTIGMLISIKSIRESAPSLLTISTSLPNDILSFINRWTSSSNRTQPKKQTSTEQIQLLNAPFHIPTNVPVDGNEQINFILHKIILEIIDSSIPAIKIFTCMSCKFTIHTRFNINYIPLNMVEGKYHLREQLNNYFGGFISDHICYKCSTSMSRHIKLLECPSVIILHIRCIDISSTVLRKPPNAIFFQPFLEKFNIGCTSSSIYDVVAFISIMPNTDNKLVLATKIKQRWRISSMPKLIGNGEKLCKLFANSRLIILERLRTCNSNFIFAIAQCCSVRINDITENNIKACETLNAAVKIIESKTTFYNLNSLLTTSNCISIYERYTDHSQVYATPLTWQATLDLHCSVCDEKINNVNLPTHSQVHHQYPVILMFYSSRTTLRAVRDLCIELGDDNIRDRYAYRSISVLLIDEYNSISVIKLEKLQVYCSNPYETTTTLSHDSINDLFHSAQKTIIFLQQSTTTPTPTPFLFKSPLPVHLVNKSTGKLTTGSIRSLAISQNLSIKQTVNGTIHHST